MIEKISLLVPFRSDNGIRQEHWDWLERYWKVHLPNAELIVSDDPSGHEVFSKTCAVNNAFAQSTGDIIVILDADAYLRASIIEHCAHRLRSARKHGAHTWFVPYRHMYRLDEDDTEQVIESDPAHPFWPDPDEESPDGSGTAGFAHHYGALIQIMPREAFELVGGMDIRFRGWGGEDISFLIALDILWGRHKNITKDVFHLWHPTLGRSPRNAFIRTWKNQPYIGANDRLALRYRKAARDADRMRNLVDEPKE